MNHCVPSVHVRQSLQEQRNRAEEGGHVVQYGNLVMYEPEGCVLHNFYVAQQPSAYDKTLHVICVYSGNMHLCRVVKFNT